MGSKKHTGREQLVIIQCIDVSILCLVRNLKFCHLAIHKSSLINKQKEKIIIARIKDFVLLSARNS